MSGGVWIGDHMVSLHHGVVGGFNSSTFMPFIIREVRALFAPEAKMANYDTWAVNSNMMDDVISKNSKTLWKAKDFDAKKIYADVRKQSVDISGMGSWALEMEEFDPESNKTIVVKGRQYALVEEMQSSQSVRDPKKVVDLVRETFVPTQVEGRSQETKLASCSICSKTFKTRKGLLMHVKDKHNVSLEANFEYQDGSGDSFLELRGVQPPLKLKKSKPILKSENEQVK